MEYIITYFNAIRKLSDELNDYWRSVIEHKEITRHELLVKGTNVNVYFVKSGWLRTYYINTDRKEVSLRFIKKGEMFTSIANFFSISAGNEYTQAIEDTEIEFFPYKVLNHIYEKYPEFNYVARVLYERHLATLQLRVYMLQLPTALQRYRFLLQFNPEFFQHIPNKYIASYLGITEQSFSRLRSKRK